MTGLILLALLQTAALSPAADTLPALPPVVPDTVVVQIDTAAAPAEAAADTSGIDIRADTGEAVETVQRLINGFFAALPKIGISLVVFALFWLLAKGVQAVVHRATPGPTTSSIGIVLGRLAYVFVLILGGFVALVVVIPSLTFGSLVAGLGIGGVAIGFAFQDIFQNLLAGILILLREPFRQGDEITSGNYTGTVEAIETRATFIRTYDGQRIIVPNSQIYSQPVSVITAYDMVRSQYDVGIGYGDDIATAKRIALEAVQGVEGVLADPAPDVLTWDLAGSSVNLRVRWWTDPTRKSVVVVRDKVLMGVKEAILAAGIDLPFPTQQILFHDQTEATDGDRRRQREGWPPGKDVPEQGGIADAIHKADGGQRTAEAPR